MINANGHQGKNQAKEEKRSKTKKKTREQMKRGKLTIHLEERTLGPPYSVMDEFQKRKSEEGRGSKGKKGGAGGFKSKPRHKTDRKRRKWVKSGNAGGFGPVVPKT